MTLVIVVVVTVLLLICLTNTYLVDYTKEGFTTEFDSCLSTHPENVQVTNVDSDMQFWSRGACQSPRDLNNCAKQYSLTWGNDPLIFRRQMLPDNPFAKDSGSHCRSDVQCKSGKCHGWFCE